MYNSQNSINSTGTTPTNSTTSTTSITNTTPTFNLFWLLKKFKGLLLVLSGCHAPSDHPGAKFSYCFQTLKQRLN